MKKGKATKIGKFTFPLHVDYKANEILVKKGVKKIITLGNAYKSRQTGRVFSANGISPTIQTEISSTGFIKIRNKYRRLTPVETERIQGFPDNWTRFGRLEGKSIKISDTQRYKLMGNAVDVRLIKSIGKKLIEISINKTLGTVKRKNQQKLNKQIETLTLIKDENTKTYNRNDLELLVLALELELEFLKTSA